MLKSMIASLLALFNGTHVKDGRDGLVFYNNKGFDNVILYDRFYADKQRDNTDTVVRNKSHFVPYSDLDTVNINRLEIQNGDKSEWFELWYDEGCWFYHRSR